MNSTINKLELYYSDIVFSKNLFSNIPKNSTKLKFGFICPGAIKTIEYLTKNIKSNSSQILLHKLRRLTDAMFFLEILVIYKKYLVKKIDIKLNHNQICLITNKLTKEISKILAKFPKYLKQNLPDDFYHIRHNTLICSNDINLAKNRIKMLKKVYK